MIEDLRDTAPYPEKTDVIVVGAGAVGIPLAVQLARGGKRVLLLEAGGRAKTGTLQGFEGTTSVGRHLRGLQEARLRSLGGTTNAWGGQLLEFDPIVFEQRDWVDGSRWPITRRDLDPFYELTFEMLGMRDRIKNTETLWQKLNVAPPDTGRDLDLFFTRWTPEPNFSRVFRSDLATNPNLHVMTNAPVVGLSRLESGRRFGVTVAPRHGDTLSLSARHVVLAQGTIEIARLLSMPLTSGEIAPWTGNPWLGKGFCDHVDADVGTVRLTDPERFHQIFDGALLHGHKYLPKLKLSSEAQRRRRLLGIAGHFVFQSGHENGLKAIKGIVRSLMQGHLNMSELQDWRALAAIPKVAIPAAMHLLRNHRIYNPGDGGITLRVTGEQMPLRESGLRLTGKNDPQGMPIAEIDWRIDGQPELETIATFSSLVADFLKREGLAQVSLDPRLTARDPGFLSKIEDGFHQMGMARMGASPSDGVVDKDLRVFGTDNLFVAGAAAFRPAGFPNPTLTAIALALRLGDFLLRQPAGRDAFAAQAG
ncbi:MULTISPECIES: FAD-dependent oxidoreductase [Chelativorans]|jgi:choline dehydrogenase-like flavoprotein|uniref:FAD dependent oxidoreductase n=1 Tax=Chelativorans sp. (strain BNC1) TaxID=266779 RepID=Q11KP3_CHESB